MGRSPSYPILSLEDSLVHARAVYARYGRSSVSEEEVVAEWHQALHGKSRRLLSALRQYRLLERAGAGLRLSATGVTLVMSPEDTQEWKTALVHGATEPMIFGSLVERYGGELPSDGLLESHLVGERGFSPAGARKCILTMRENMAYMGDAFLAVGTAEAPGVSGRDEQDEVVQTASPEPRTDPGTTSRGGTERSDKMIFETPLTSGEARVEILGEITMDDLPDLRSWLSHVQVIVMKRASKAEGQGGVTEEEKALKEDLAADLRAQATELTGDEKDDG